MMDQTKTNIGLLKSQDEDVCRNESLIKESLKTQSDNHEQQPIKKEKVIDSENTLKQNQETEQKEGDQEQLEDKKQSVLKQEEQEQEESDSDSSSGDVVGFDPLLLNALSSSQQDRLMMLKLDKEIENFLNDN
eukprot:Pgem_evm1s19889